MAKTNLCYGITPIIFYEVMVNLETSSPVLESNGDINQSKCERLKACIDAFLEKNPRMTLQLVEQLT